MDAPSSNQEKLESPESVLWYMTIQDELLALTEKQNVDRCNKEARQKGDKKQMGLYNQTK